MSPVAFSIKRQKQKRQEVVLNQTQNSQFMLITRTHSLHCASLAFGSLFGDPFTINLSPKTAQSCLVTIASITGASNPISFFNARSFCTPCCEAKPGQDRRRFVTIIQAERCDRSRCRSGTKWKDGYQFRVVTGVVCEFFGPHITYRSCLRSCMPNGM